MDYSTVGRHSADGVRHRLRAAQRRHKAVLVRWQPAGRRAGRLRRGGGGGRNREVTVRVPGGGQRRARQDRKTHACFSSLSLLPGLDICSENLSNFTKSRKVSVAGVPADSSRFV